MDQTRDLFKKIRDTKGTFHEKMGSTKDRNGMNLIEAEDIKSRWQEYTEELYKKDLHDPDNHDGVITYLSQTSWNVKSSGPQEASLRTKVEVMEFQPSYFISRKMTLRKCCTQRPANLENSAVATGLEKVSFHSNPKERQCQRMLKLPHNCTYLICQ